MKRQIIVIAFFAALAVTGVLSVLILKGTKREYTVSGLLIPDRVQAYSGTVREVTPRFVLIEALSANNYLPKDTRLRVDIVEDTKITRYRLLKRVPYGVDTPQGEEVPILVSDIHVGDMITVYSEMNLKGKTMFPADVIRVVELVESDK